MPAIGSPVQGYYYDAATDTLRPIAATGPAGPAGPTGPAGPAGPLDILTDTTIATPADNQVLMYEASSSQWKNKAGGVPVFADITARDAWTSPPNGSMCYTIADGFTWRRQSGVWNPMGAFARCSSPGGAIGTAVDVTISLASFAPAGWSISGGTRLVLPWTGNYMVHATIGTTGGAGTWVMTTVTQWRGGSAIVQGQSAQARLNFNNPGYSFACAAIAGDMIGMNIASDVTGNTQEAARTHLSVVAIP